MLETLAHAGLALSSTSINSTVTSLSRNAHRAMRSLGQTRLAAIAYDNFDVALSVATPTVEKGGGQLLHLTSGTLLPLCHDVQLQDLEYSQYLWERSRLNVHRTMDVDLGQTYQKLISLRNRDIDNFGQTAHQQYQAWKFRYNLTHHGPEYFRRFIQQLGRPPTLDQIPIVKTEQIPVRAMDINQSTAKGNADAIVSILNQAGVGDSSETTGLVELGDCVVITHGDLSTCERVQGIQASRAIEQTSWRRFQFVVFLPGLFHVKMACTDVLFRMFVQPKEARNDNTGLMPHVAILRPNETGKVASNPGFRRMHEIITHDGIASHLDCWRTEIERRNPTVKSLEDFATHEPSWETIEEISRYLTQEYVAAGSFEKSRRRPDCERDMEFENSLLKNQVYLLYEEISYAMNAGDIGRVEHCLVSWVPLFKATGKNKYASQVTSFLIDLHYLYPAPLR